LSPARGAATGPPSLKVESLPSGNLTLKLSYDVAAWKSSFWPSGNHGRNSPDEQDILVADGYKFASVPVLAAVGAGLLKWYIPGGIFLALGIFILCFFRDPDRIIPSDELCVVSPADGRVMEVVDESLGDRAGRRISIFLALWNVHVNRSPMAGRITRIDYRPGKFHMAMKKAASAENEQNIITLQTERGEIVFKQIAGWVARRVVLWKKSGEEVSRGERIGIVRFGSRMDLWLPRNVEIVVKPGDNVAGGSSVLARWPSDV
jgi:phosphatidylserine decarboxylase